MDKEYLITKIGHLKEQRDHARATADRFCEVNNVLIEENEALQAELELVRADRDAFQKDAAFWKGQRDDANEKAAALRAELDKARKDAEHAKTMFNIAFSYLDQSGYDVEKLGMIVALKLSLMERGMV